MLREFEHESQAPATDAWSRPGGEALATAPSSWHVGARVPRPSGKKHEVAVVGLGAMGRRHARVLATLADRFTLVGAYDVSSAAPAVDGVTRLSSEAEAIARAEVLFVATPIDAHAATVARALAAGRHVLVEKPLCARASEAEAMAAASQRAKAQLFVGHSERFNPVVRALARLVKAMPVLALDLVRVGPSRPTACGVLLNLAVHDFDLAAYLGGGAATLRGAIGTPLSRRRRGGHGARAAHDGIRCPGARPRRSHRAASPPPAHAPDPPLDLRGRLARAPAPADVHARRVRARTYPFLSRSLSSRRRLRWPTRSTGSPPREIATATDGARAVALAERAAAVCASAGPARVPAAFAGIPR